MQKTVMRSAMTHRPTTVAASTRGDTPKGHLLQTTAFPLPKFVGKRKDVVGCHLFVRKNAVISYLFV